MPRRCRRSTQPLLDAHQQDQAVGQSASPAQIIVCPLKLLVVNFIPIGELNVPKSAIGNQNRSPCPERRPAQTDVEPVGWAIVPAAGNPPGVWVRMS